jgi:hypothetical protein
MSAEASIRVVAEDSAASVAVALLDIHFLFAIQAPGLLGAEPADLRRESSYSGGYWVIWNRAQHNVVAAIFGEDGSSAPSLAHRRGDGHLAPAGYDKSLCHDHYNLP